MSADSSTQARTLHSAARSVISWQQLRDSLQTKGAQRGCGAAAHMQSDWAATLAQSAEADRSNSKYIIGRAEACRTCAGSGNENRHQSTKL